MGQHRSNRTKKNKEPRLGFVSVLGGALGTVLALVIYAPASWLASAIHVASQGRVQLMQVQGSVWNGSAAVVLAGAAGSSAAMTWPSRWQWRVSPQALGVGVELHAACCTSQPIELQAGFSGLQISSAALQMSASVLQGLGAPWNTLQLQGDLQLHWPAVHWAWQQPPSWQGSLQLQALRVSSRLSTLPQIGSYQAELQAGSNPQLQISTLQGPLQLEGQGTIQQGRLKFEGQAYAQPEQAQALANLLNLLGERSGQKTRIKWG